MTINELKECIQNLINDDYQVSVHLEMISANNGLKTYNALIRNEVQNLAGIYIWENDDNNEILYIGMSGKITQQGILVNHSVKNRLQASRGIDSETGRDILTNKYIKNLMFEENCNQLNIHIIHLHDGQMPSYAEAVLINAFYQRNGLLPKYNNAF